MAIQLSDFINQARHLGIKRPSLNTYTWFCIALGFVIGFQALNIGGYEWYWWREATLSSGFLIRKVANPPYVGILLYPLAILPLRLGIFLFSLISIVCLYAVHRLANVNKWFLLASYPALRVIFYSQLDVLTLLGAALGLWAVNRGRPLLVGVAITLLGIKPQAGAAIALIYFLWARDWRVFVFPAVVTLISFIRYGFWPQDWIYHLAEFRSGHLNPSMTEWPASLFLWVPLILLRRYYSRAQLVGAVASMSILTAPYYQSYSTLTSMAMPYPFWIYPLYTLPRFTSVIPPIAVILVIIVYPLVTAALNRISFVSRVRKILS